MSTLEELRRTMDRHADDIHDDAVHVRAAAVRRRGRQVRRQRRVGAGIATVAAAAAVVAVVALPGGRSPQPADRRLLGMEAPATMTSLGYTYVFSRGLEGDATRTTVRLPASDAPRVLTWADRGTGTIRVRTADDRTILSTGDFEDYTTIPAGQAGTWTVEGADTAAAVYTLDAALPPDGVTRAGITYRTDVLDHHLVAADIGDAGDATLSGSVRLTAGPVGFSSFCTGGGPRTWIHAKVVGATGSFGANCTAPVFDPGGNVESQFEWPSTGPATIRLWATEGEHGPLSTDPDLRLGYGLYSYDLPATRLAGFEVEQRIEYDGHEWAMTFATQGPSGARRFADLSSDGGPQLVVAAFSHTGGPVHTSLAGRPGAAFSGAGLGGSTVLGVAQPGSPPTRLRISGPVDPRARLGLAFYHRVD